MIKGNKTSPFYIYYHLYGGYKAILKSKYSYLALLISLLCWPMWVANDEEVRPWINAALSVIPSLMAFSLGGMAILLAFSNEKLMDAIQQKGKPHSLFMKAVATFFHFLLLQTICLIFVFVTLSFPHDIISYIGFFFMIYGLLVAIATAGILLQIAQIFNATASLPKDSSEGKRDAEM